MPSQHPFERLPRCDSQPTQGALPARTDQPSVYVVHSTATKHRVMALTQPPLLVRGFDAPRLRAVLSVPDREVAAQIAEALTNWAHGDQDQDGYAGGLLDDVYDVLDTATQGALRDELSRIASSRDHQPTWLRRRSASRGLAQAHLLARFPQDCSSPARKHFARPPHQGEQLDPNCGTCLNGALSPQVVLYLDLGLARANGRTSAVTRECTPMQLQAWDDAVRELRAQLWAGTVPAPTTVAGQLVLAALCDRWDDNDPGRDQLNGDEDNWLTRLVGAPDWEDLSESLWKAAQVLIPAIADFAEYELPDLDEPWFFLAAAARLAPDDWTELPIERVSGE